MSGPRAIGARLEMLWEAPESLRSEAHWLRRAWLRVGGAAREPAMEATALKGFSEAPADLERWRAHAAAIFAELEANVARLEEFASLHGRVPAAPVDWLLALHRWALSMERAARAPSRHARHALRHGLASRALLGSRTGGEQEGHELALAGVDALLDEAAAEMDRLGRRRRLLEAARALLLDVEAATGATRGATNRRRVIAHELEALTRFGAAGVRPDMSLSGQLSAARRGRDSRRALATCAALAYVRAGSSDPLPRALEALAEELDPGVVAALPASVTTTIERGYAAARATNAAAMHTAGPSEALALRRQRGELGDGARRELLRMALGVDGLFDVGGALERDRVAGPVAAVERVAHPTEALELRAAQHPNDVVDAVIDDPRLWVLHLATRRLLVRRYRRRRVREGRRARARAAVRFYLLDGSSSMLGPRARMRDAILIAELASLVSRLERPAGRIHSLLYYRYFNSGVEPTRRVATLDEAYEAIESVLGRQLTGGTDLQGALEDTLDLIADAQRADVELTRAQLVLVTDGLAAFDADDVRRIQERLDTPVQVSVVVLGAESTELRRLAALQREAGMKVVYQRVSDEELEAMAGGDDAWANEQPADVLRASGALSEHDGLDEPTLLDPAADELAEALREVGLSDEALEEGVRAKREAAQRDRRALDRRFDRLFPALSFHATGVLDPDDVEAAAVIDALSVIVEVLAMAPTNPQDAKADAIALLVRLLRTRGLTPPEYLGIARAHPDRVGPAIDAIRDQCRRPRDMVVHRGSRAGR